MRLRWILVVLLLSACQPLATRAQEDVDEEVSVNLTERLRSVEFTIVSGRVAAVGTRLVGANLHTAAADAATGHREKLTIDFSQEFPLVLYERVNSKEELHVDLRDADHLVLSRQLLGRAGSNSVEYGQATPGEVSLTLRSGDKVNQMRARSLWHLMLAEPKLCREHLAPLLEELRPAWHLNRMAHGIEEGLLRWAAEHNANDQRHWAKLVADLGSERFSVRRSAQRQLLDAGQLVIPFLQSLDRSSMDAEQRHRVYSLIASLDYPREDSVASAVLWLSADPQTWLALLDRDEESKRAAAWAQFVLLTGDAPRFQPAATAATRTKQLAELRAQYPLAKSDGK